MPEFAVTHTFLLPREPSEGHKCQGLGSKRSIGVPSGFSFFNHDACVLRRLQVESRGLGAPIPSPSWIGLTDLQACFSK